jgi:hypothetical protein
MIRGGMMTSIAAVTIFEKENTRRRANRPGWRVRYWKPKRSWRVSDWSWMV